MKEDKYSFTAEASAIFRAIGTYEKDEQLRSPDYMAINLISSRFKSLINFGLTRKLSTAYTNWKFPGLYESHLARTHHYDKIVKDELQNRAKQYVILGAGLDTRAYRIANQFGNCHVFEVDHPATSKFKRLRLEQAGIASKNVTYVEVDFIKEKTWNRLLEEGLNKDLCTLFTWEGVIMYLNDEAVRETLKFISSMPPGSSVIFDYIFEDLITNPEKLDGAEKHVAYVKKIGEPYTFGINYDNIKRYVSNTGLEMVSNLGPEDLKSQYLKNHHRGVNDWYAIAHSRVP